MARHPRRGLPLRIGLVAATLLLVTCGLVTSGVAVTSILRHSLISRIDSNLLEASRSWAQAPRRQSAPPYEGPDPGRPPSKFYVRGVGSDGTTFTAINDRNAEPALPPNNDVGVNPVTLPSVNGSDILWRAVSVRGPHGLTTVAIDLSDVQHTVRSLVWLQFGIGVAVRPPPTPTMTEQIMAAPDKRTVSGQLAGGTATVVFSRDMNAGVLEMNNVPPPSQGTVYQMWLIDDKGPLSAGTMDAAAVTPSVTHLLRNLGKSRMLAFTVEPGNGSVQPTGTIITKLPLS